MSAARPKPYRIAYFGTSDFAVPALERLRADGDFLVVEAVTQPDKPVGRKRLLTAPPVKRAAESLGIPVWQPTTLKDEAALAHLQALDVDAYVVASYGKILPRRVLDVPRFGGINLHASLLPAWRGASPIAAAIAAGDAETGVTVMLMDEKLDEGPELARRALPIDADDTTETLSRKLAELGAEMVGAAVKGWIEGRIEAVPQDHAKATFTKILEREDGRIDWKKSAGEIERLVRALKPWPEAHALWTRKGQPLRLTLKRAALIHPTSACGPDLRPGSVCRLADGTVGVNCGQGSLQLVEVQLEGKNAMDARSFVNGHPDFVGSRLE